MQANSSQVEVTDEGRGGGGGGRRDGAGLGSKRGTKRAASDSNWTDHERFDLERFEKRLRLLSLRNSDRNGADKSTLYTPVTYQTPGSPTSTNDAPTQSHTSGMQVDDRPDKIYIHDLDAELADIDSSDEKERLIFLPDIEKHFSKLPHQVLATPEESNRELILYDVPRSLTLDEGHDSVRKAIIEARQRAREKALEDSRRADLERRYGRSELENAHETAHGYGTGYESVSQMDPDAMDMDMG